MAITLLELFPDKIKLAEPSYRFPGVTGSCWLWRGDIAKGGYGKVFYNGRWWATHRLSLVLAKFPIPHGAWVGCHKCDVRSCCNPEHLFVGSNEQNAYDTGKWAYVIDNQFVAGDLTYDQWRELGLNAPLPASSEGRVPRWKWNMMSRKEKRKLLYYSRRRRRGKRGRGKTSSDLEIGLR